MAKTSTSTVLSLVIFMAIISLSPLAADWEVRRDTIGEGIPTWMAVMKSRDGRLLFWIEYPADGLCVPHIVLKSDGWEAFAFDPGRLESIATVIRFSRQRLLQVPGYAGNGFIFEWQLEKEHFAELMAGFVEEKELLVSLPGRAGEVSGAFDLDGAAQAIDEACTACEQGFLENNDFVFVDSSDRRLDRDEVVRLSPRMLRMARNEIFARRGRVFKDPALDRFFRMKKWYQPVQGDIELTTIEKANVALFLACAKE